MIHKYRIQSADEILTDLIQRVKTSSNNTLTKFTKNSVARGILYAFANSLSYLRGYISLVETKKFLSTCSLEDLDNYAKEYFNVTRKAASKSSAEVYVYATPGTTYPAGSQFKSTTGVDFVSLEEVTVPVGLTFAFIQVESIGHGANTKVYAESITTCINPPTGHISCTNFIPSLGGYDEESDDELRARLYKIPHKVSQETPAKIEAIAYELFPEIGKCNCFATSYGFANLSVLKVSGADFSQQERDTIKAGIQQYLGYSNSINLQVTNIQKLYIDLKASLTVKASADFTEVYERIQEVLLAFFEPRFYTASSIRGEVVLSELTKISDIIDIDQSSFSLVEDIRTPRTTLPWLRTINLDMAKETGEKYTVNQTIPQAYISSFNPNNGNSFKEVL